MYQSVNTQRLLQQFYKRISRYRSVTHRFVFMFVLIWIIYRFPLRAHIDDSQLFVFPLDAIDFIERYEDKTPARSGNAFTTASRDLSENTCLSQRVTPSLPFLPFKTSNKSVTLYPLSLVIMYISNKTAILDARKLGVNQFLDWMTFARHGRTGRFQQCNNSACYPPLAVVEWRSLFRFACVFCMLFIDYGTRS